jgi:hypothetical protein
MSSRACRVTRLAIFRHMGDNLFWAIFYYRRSSYFWATFFRGQSWYIHMY